MKRTLAKIGDVFAVASMPACLVCGESPFGEPLKKGLCEVCRAAVKKPITAESIRDLKRQHGRAA